MEIIKTGDFNRVFFYFQNQDQAIFFYIDHRKDTHK